MSNFVSVVLSVSRAVSGGRTENPGDTVAVSPAEAERMAAAGHCLPLDPPADEPSAAVVVASEITAMASVAKPRSRKPASKPSPS